MCFNMLKSRVDFFTALTFDSPSHFLFLFTFVKKFKRQNESAGWSKACGFWFYGFKKKRVSCHSGDCYSVRKPTVTWSQFTTWHDASSVNVKLQLDGGHVVCTVWTGSQVLDLALTVHFLKALEIHYKVSFTLGAFSFPIHFSLTATNTGPLPITVALKKEFRCWFLLLHGAWCSID